jgi:glucosyl-3-phosphoglycerate phosphatase
MSTGAARVFLARHGRTAMNAEGRLRGLSDPVLDEIGLTEAAQLAEALASKDPTAVISSPLQRAVATAHAIGAACSAPVHVDRRLNDRDYGPMTGRVRADVEREHGSVDAAPGVEPLAELKVRAYNAFLDLADDFGPGPLVMVSHDAFNRALLGQLDPALADVEQRTACWNELSRAGGRWHVDAFNLVNR